MERLKFKTLYSPHEPRKFAVTTTGESLTQQQFKEECDVNNILSKYRRTGMVSHLAKHQGNFGDFSSVEDYQNTLDKLMTAQRSFESLPSELRSKFENDPAKLIAFLDDKQNDEEAIKLGLKIEIKKEPTMQESMEKALAANDAKRQKADKKA
nr:MAG: internal scaffolding protein [Microvirus sp.]